MALVFADRVQETTLTTGTATLALAGASAQCQSFSAGIGNGNTVDYGLLSGNGTDWETGIGTYTSSGNTLSRDTVYASSNGGSKIVLSGTSTVFGDMPAHRLNGTMATQSASAVAITGGSITGINAPSADTDVALFENITGARWKQVVGAATTGALPACTYANGSSGVGATLTANSNGALPSIDGTSSTAGNVYLIKNQASALQNGIYQLTTPGDGSNPWVLTRVSWYDSQTGLSAFTNEISCGDVIPVASGSVNAATSWMQTTQGTITVGTTGLVFVKFGPSTLAGETDVAISSPADKDILVYDTASATWKNQRPKYTIGVFVPGIMTASQKLLYHRFAKAVTLPANLGSYLGLSSEAGGSANATASTVINIDKAATATPNTFSNVGTITIASGTVTPTFATSGGSAVSFAQGDVLRIVGPVTPDATFADFCATLVGYET